MTAFSRYARLYFQPTAFVASPFGHDGAVVRLAGGLVWFSAYEVIAVDAGARVGSRLVPVAAIDDFIATLSDEQAEIARTTIARITAPRCPFALGERVLRLDQPQIMSILNMTPDSFSDGGQYLDDPAAATASGFAAMDAGATIVDVGGESTRPGAKPVWEGDEIARIEPIVRRLAAGGAIVSIDTRKAAVMEAALAAGAAIVNDVSALTYDPQAAALLARHACPVVLMHHQGDPETMQREPRYGDALVEVYDWLEQRIAFAEAAGIARDRIIVDPGIGFGKNLRHNLQILNSLALFHGLGCPILLGASRKRIIGALSNEAGVDERLGGSVALALHGAQQGAQILRVHDVPETLQAIRVWRGLRDEALTPPIH
ncbi:MULTISPECIES: dihydropteroate synthase [unclassified Sphingomonas]|uniref:dihydropteroate synthase n=1 Tax=unclassified Sphingomonas TaxID=196159 RepID=UPI0006F83DFD|nr:MULTISPECIES: dihydropteroate synthase [unclassified Sphingomonas]KQX19059.1 dihydropteroate synthase [Sphingomonas sp. Root1294]KQY65260.1 dihydropteroate synthase [Sphingomonas sp. Root50]KRB95446.1 dihydropteroate synthase [Sphingomonas sp. Root720]